MADNKSKDDSMTTKQAGKLGGDETAKRGPEFYSEIGQRQGKQNNPGNFANRDKEDVKKAAAEGGRHSHDNDNREADE